MKTFILVVISLLCLCLGYAQTDEPDYLGYFPVAARYVTAPSGLNMRSAPELNASIVAKLPYGAEVQSHRTRQPIQVGDRQGAWEEVKYHGKVGFVFNPYLSVIPAPEVKGDPENCEFYPDFGYESLLNNYLKKQLFAQTEELPLLEVLDRDDDTKYHTNSLQRFEKGVVVFRDYWYESSQTSMRVFGFTPDQALAWVEALITYSCPSNPFIEEKAIRIKDDYDNLIQIRDGVQDGFYFTIYVIGYLQVEIRMESGV